MKTFRPNDIDEKTNFPNADPIKFYTIEEEHAHRDGALFVIICLIKYLLCLWGLSRDVVCEIDGFIRQQKLLSNAGVPSRFTNTSIVYFLLPIQRNHKISVYNKYTIQLGLVRPAFVTISVIATV